MESLIITAVFLFAGYAIFSKFILPIFKNPGDLPDENEADEDNFYYKKPLVNPATGLKMQTKSGSDVSGKFYGEG